MDTAMGLGKVLASEGVSEVGKGWDTLQDEELGKVLRQGKG